jgi:hypothetical protein
MRQNVLAADVLRKVGSLKELCWLVARLRIEISNITVVSIVADT